MRHRLVERVRELLRHHPERPTAFDERRAQAALYPHFSRLHKPRGPRGIAPVGPSREREFDGKSTH